MPMIDGEETPPLVSVLFVTYKRFEFLKKSVDAFRKNTLYPCLQLVVADDGSGEATQDLIRTLPVDTFALSPVNRGLGANMNQGLSHCKGKYVLVLQDDCMCYGPPEYLREAVGVLEANRNVGLINFAGAAHPPDTSLQLTGSNEPCYVTPQALQGGEIEFFLYSDQPHLQSREAIDYVGPYLESRDMEECEIDYNHRWKNQTQYATAVFPAYYMRVFIHEGEEHSFRTTRVRYKVHDLLRPAKPFLETHMPGVFKTGKSAVQSILRFMEKRGLIR